MPTPPRYNPRKTTTRHRKAPTMSTIDDLELVPTHDCTGDPDTCPHPQGFVFAARDAADGVGVDTTMQAHLLDADTIVTTIVRMIDGLMIQMEGDAPEIIKFARGREMLRAAVEGTPPPDEVMEAITGMAESHDDE